MAKLGSPTPDCGRVDRSGLPFRIAVGVQNAVAPIELQEREEVAQRLLRLAHQMLVPHLYVLRVAMKSSPRSDPFGPIVEAISEHVPAGALRLLHPWLVSQRAGDIASVADDMDQPRPREMAP